MGPLVASWLMALLAGGGNWEVGPVEEESLGRALEGHFLSLAVPAFSLLTGSREVSTSALPRPSARMSCHTPSPETLEPSDRGLTPLKPGAKIKSFLL